MKSYKAQQKAIEEVRRLTGEPFYPSGSFSNLLLNFEPHKQKLQPLEKDLLSTFEQEIKNDASYRFSSGIPVPMQFMNSVSLGGRGYYHRERAHFIKNQPINLPLGRLGVLFDESNKDSIARYSKYTTFPQAQWLNDNEAAAPVDPGRVEIEPDYKRLYLSIELDRLFYNQISPEARDYFIAQTITRSIFEAIQKAIVNGDGVKELPGILNDPDIPVLYAGNAADDTTNANGAQITADDIANMEEAIGAKKDDFSSLGLLTSIPVRKALKETPRFTGSSVDVWSGMDDYLTEASSIVPNNLSKGSSNNLTAAIFGDWSSIMVSLPKAVNIEPDIYSQSNKRIISLSVNMYVSLYIPFPDSLVVIKDISTP